MIKKRHTTPRTPRSAAAKNKKSLLRATPRGVKEQAAKAFDTMIHLGRAKITTLEQLFVEQLKDLYSAETQLISALPKMAQAAHAPDLKKGFQTHLAETKEHARRIESILSDYEEKPTGKTCKAMKGLIEEGNETISENASPEVKDAALIAAAQRVEHYEMAGYGCVRTYAQILGNEKAARILQQTLNEESATDEKLTVASTKLNLKLPLTKEE